MKVTVIPVVSSRGTVSKARKRNWGNWRSEEDSRQSIPQDKQKRNEKDDRRNKEEKEVNGERRKEKNRRKITKRKGFFFLLFSF